MPGNAHNQAALRREERSRLSDWRETPADAATDHPEFAAELPRFLSAIYRVFNPYEVVGYVATRKPRVRKALQRLLLIDRP